VTVLRIAHYGAGKPPSEPQNIMLGRCRRGALQFGEDIEVEVKSGLPHRPDGTQVMIDHSRRPLTSRHIVEVAQIRCTEQSTGGDDVSVCPSGAVETVNAASARKDAPS